MVKRIHYIVIEILSIESIWPILWKLKKISATGDSVFVYYIDSAWRLDRLLKWYVGHLGGVCERLEFRLIDIKDDEGDLTYLKIVYEDLPNVQKKIFERAILKQTLEFFNDQKYLQHYLSKEAVLSNLSAPETIIRAFFIIRVALWKIEQMNAQGRSLTVIGRKRDWPTDIKDYFQAAALNYEEVYIFGRKSRAAIVKVVKNIVYGFHGIASNSHIHHGVSGSNLLIDYYGHLYLDEPQMFSDLFFYQESELKGENILLSFRIPSDPLSKDKLESLTKHHIKPVVFNPRAVERVSVATYYERKTNPSIKWPQYLSQNKLPIEKWIKSNVTKYYKDVDYWEKFFKRFQIKLYTTWYKYDAQHIVMSEALRRVGGISTVYQRAFEEFSAPKTAIATDIVFGFSSDKAMLEKKAGSHFCYHVVTGWLGDHRVNLLRPKAKEIRAQLQAKGARHIFAYFDEGSLEDDRWHTGHKFMRKNYSFLLEKILDHSDLGLVIKPKTSKTLRKRLGDVSSLLERAEETGRCLVLEEGNIVSSYPPTLAALASDITIHGCFAAASAGVEAILSGARTIMFDGEWWSKSSLYGCSKDSRVFRDWNILWGACEHFLKHPDQNNNFGRWDDQLEFFDPFRDGKAAYRMGTFLQWLQEGFEKGVNREINMIQAVEQYRKIWGEDKVIGAEGEG